MVDIERLGGFAGFGGPGSRLQSRGTVDTSALTEPDKQAIETLFAKPAPPLRVQPDGYLYRLTRHTDSGQQTIEVADQQVPDTLKAAVKDRIV